MRPPSRLPRAGLAAAWRSAGTCELWRRHSDAVNIARLAGWLPPAPVATLLKTDLFDEALTDGLYPFLGTRAHRVVGVDLSAAVASDARRRRDGLLGACADVRRLPLPDACVDTVVSASTLDHFSAIDDIAGALAELARVLRPGGRLLVTLDNQANPAVALRNRLPHSLLYRIGAIPYGMGASCGPRRLRRLLVAAGFVVEELTAILHCPRFAAVAAAGLLERRAGERTRRRFLRALMSFERLARTPARFVTGHFLAAHATRRVGPAPR